MWEKCGSKSEKLLFSHSLVYKAHSFSTKITHRVIQDIKNPPYTGSVADWAQDAMNDLVKNGVVSGSGGKLNSTDTTTRAEMAQVLYNLLGK